MYKCTVKDFYLKKSFYMVKLYKTKGTMNAGVKINASFNFDMTYFELFAKY